MYAGDCCDGSFGRAGCDVERCVVWDFIPGYQYAADVGRPVYVAGDQRLCRSDNQHRRR